MLSLFKKLNKSKGAGPDGIYGQLIIDCADLIAPHIISITFNSSLAIMVYFLRIGSPQRFNTPLFIVSGERSNN